MVSGELAAKSVIGTPAGSVTTPRAALPAGVRSRNWRGAARFGVDPALSVRGSAQNREGDRGCASCTRRDTPHRGLRQRTDPLSRAASAAPVAGPWPGGTYALGAAPGNIVAGGNGSGLTRWPSVLDRQFEHLLRRAGFGARPDELGLYRALSFGGRGRRSGQLRADRGRRRYEDRAAWLRPAWTSPRGAFSPHTNILDARQRWLFRMLHSNRPLQEKMTLFWHNHFATGYTKIAGELGAAEATRYMAAKPSEDPAGVRGQIEMLRDNALGNFRDMLMAIAKDQAMLVWLDGRTNTKTRPQENFGREVMELFTMGVGHYTETDVYAAARVFTGWNLRRSGDQAAGTQALQFVYNAGQHDTNAKTFSFPIYPDGSRTIPGRPAAERHARRPGPGYGARRQPRYGTVPGHQAVSLLRLGVWKRERRVRRSDRERLPAEPVRDEAGVTGRSSCLRSSGIPRRISRGTPGLSSSSCAR